MTHLLAETFRRRVLQLLILLCLVGLSVGLPALAYGVPAPVTQAVTTVDADPTPPTNVSANATTVAYGNLTDTQQQQYRKAVAGRITSISTAGGLSVGDYIVLDGEYHKVITTQQFTLLGLWNLWYLAGGLLLWGLSAGLVAGSGLHRVTDRPLQALTGSVWADRLVIVVMGLCLVGGVVGVGGHLVSTNGPEYKLAGTPQETVPDDATVVDYETLSNDEQQRFTQIVGGRGGNRFHQPVESRSFNYATTDYIKSDGEYYRLYTGVQHSLVGIGVVALIFGVPAGWVAAAVLLIVFGTPLHVAVALATGTVATKDL